jgi:hypothetical protein
LFLLVLLLHHLLQYWLFLLQLYQNFLLPLLHLLVLLLHL